MLKKIDHCNVEAMVGVRDMILNTPPETFDMTNWCGTAKCIAGHAVVWAGVKAREEDIKDAASDILELSYGTAEDLFIPDVEKLDWTTITPAHAAQAMDNVIAFDDPKWDEVMA